jgi:hypothetical protein
MPEKKHLRGVSEKEQRQYEHIKEEAKKEGRYRGRQKEGPPEGGCRAHGDEAAQAEGPQQGR